ncbi:MAG: hypothetical protein JRD89_01605 [Deltaproteobacteria bacterium]|nr:hypothetical protein [Deltaproteobacteria bacterium]
MKLKIENFEPREPTTLEALRERWGGLKALHVTPFVTHCMEPTEMNIEAEIKQTRKAVKLYRSAADWACGFMPVAVVSEVKS